MIATFAWACGEETAVRRDFVIVPEAHCAPAGICIRWGEGKCKEPAFDHDFLQEFRRVSWLQRFSLKIEFFETFGF
jgi:hypothetical protein